MFLVANSNKVKVNALLDDGSKNTYISQEMASEFGLQEKIERVKVNVLSGKTETFETMSVSKNIESTNCQNKLDIEASVIYSVTGSLQTIDWRKQSKKYQHLQGIQFPVVKNNNHIDILICLDYAQLHTFIYEVLDQPG